MRLSIVYSSALLCLLCPFFLLITKAESAAPMEKMIKSTVIVGCHVDEKVYHAGSGFVIDRGRMVVTNYHVIAPCYFVGSAVIVSRSEAVPGRVEWKSEEKDLALLALERPLARPSVRFAPGESVRIGQDAYAAGFPDAADDERVVDTSTSIYEVKVNRGIISARVQSVNNHQLFQTDAPINPGNSGGPLFDELGHVIGINTFKSMASVLSEGQSGQDVQARITLGDNIGWAVQADELTEELDRRGISYDTASRFINNRVYRLWKQEPLILFLVFFGFLLSAAGLFFSLTRQGRGMIKNSIYHGKEVLSRRLPATAEKQPVLKGVAGEYKDIVMDLDEDPLAIGRDSRASHLVFPDDCDDISKRHCIIRFDKRTNVFMLEDCWSLNGTYLENGQRIDSGVPRTLSSGSRFYLGRPENMFEVRLIQQQL